MKFRVKKKKRSIAYKEFRKGWRLITDKLHEREYSWLCEIDDFIDDVINKKYAAFIYTQDKRCKWGIKEEKIFIYSLPKEDIKKVTFDNNSTGPNVHYYKNLKNDKLYQVIVCLPYESFDNIEDKKNFIKFCMFHEIGHVFITLGGYDIGDDALEYEILADLTAYMNMDYDINIEKFKLLLSDIIKIIPKECVEDYHDTLHARIKAAMEFPEIAKKAREKARGYGGKHEV